MTEIVIPNDPWSMWEKIVEGECVRRYRRRMEVVPQPSDSRKVVAAKIAFFARELAPKWAGDPGAYLDENAWAPDPMNLYGASAVPAGLSPKGMVPLILFDRHRELVQAWKRAIDGRGFYDIFGEKTRQEAWTTLLLWLTEHAWRFMPSFTALAGSYDVDLIDKGGKGQRDATSLFGRLRLFIDCFVWAYPFARFNAHLAPHPRAAKAKHEAWARNLTGMQEHEDVSYKLSRPPWRVGKVPICPGAEGNWIQGALPGDKFGRTYTATVALLDELYHYNKHLGPDKDREAYGASSASARIRVGWGTPPKGGAVGTYLYDRIYNRDEADDATVIRMHWTSNPVKMYGAKWRCRRCGEFNPHPIHPPPEWPSGMKTCEHCGSSVLVRARGLHAKSGGDMTSGWYEKACARSPDRESISAEIDIDHAGAADNVVCSNFLPDAALVERNDLSGWTVIQGFDPGYSEKNPACWEMWAFSPELQILRLVAYMQAASWDLAKWVPFFKCWSPERARRQRVVHATYQKHFEDYGYDAGDYMMMERASRFAPGVIRGDKYGSHRDSGADSAYETLRRRYGIEIRYEYVSDDEVLIQKVRDVWVPRIEIDPEIADFRPRSPRGHYPSFMVALMTAKWAEGSGHREEKRVISNREPPYVKHYIDALKYVVMELEDYVGMQRGPDGEWVPVAAGTRDEPFSYSGDEVLG